MSLGKSNTLFDMAPVSTVGTAAPPGPPLSEPRPRTADELSGERPPSSPRADFHRRKRRPSSHRSGFTAAGQAERHMPLLRHLPCSADLMASPAGPPAGADSFVRPGELMSGIFRSVSDHMMFCPECSRAGAPACAESRRLWRRAFR